MWEKTFSKTYQNITKEQIWQTWVDVNNWPKWDKQLEYCKLEADFIKGSQFILKPHKTDEVTLHLCEVTPYKSFTDYCKFNGATMDDTHLLKETPNGLCITITITISGMLTPLWVKLVGQKVVDSLPEQTDALVKYARQHDA